MSGVAEETNPHVKDHNGTKICFADTITQALSALSARHSPDDTDNLNKEVNDSSHLMLFGVEKWENAKAFTDQLADVKHDFSRLEIFGTDMSADAQNHLATSFGRGALDSVEKLDLDNTKLHTGAARRMMTNVASDRSKVEKLNLQGSIDSANVLKEVMEPLQASTTLNKIDLKINDIKQDGATHLGTFLKNMQQSKEFELDLFYNDLQKEGAIKIAEGLKAPQCCLTHLDMCCNNIGDEGAKAIASGLRTNRTLFCLKLALNNIGNEGAIAIFKTLYHESEKQTVDHVNYTLKILDLSANVMKDVVAGNDDKEAKKADNYANVIEQTEKMNARIDKLRSEKKEKEALELEQQLDAQVNGTQTQSLLVSTLNKVLTGAYGLIDIDFTGIELDDNGWNGLGICLASTSNFPEVKGQFWEDIKNECGDRFGEKFPTIVGHERDLMTIRFSIVDLMSEPRLKVMEGRIWEGDLKDRYHFIDWRRREDPKKEEKKEDN